MYWHWRLNQLQPGLAKANVGAKRDYHEDRPALEERSRAPGEPPYVLDIAPLRGMPSLTPFERRAERLITAARWAYNVMAAAIKNEDPEVLRTGVRLSWAKGETGQ
jgi:hypothetical protein